MKHAPVHSKLTRHRTLASLSRPTPGSRIEERPVPRSDIAEEHSWPTQPFPLKPPALVPQQLTEAELRTDDPQLYQRCLARFRTLKNEGIFTPPSTQWTMLYPGTVGGMNWSGGAFDPRSGLRLGHDPTDSHP